VALLAGLSAWTGCRDLDPSRPIALVAGPDWGEERLRSIADAAEAWNVEVGTQLYLASGSAAHAEQEALIRRSRFVCAYASGLFDSVGDDDIHLCELDLDGPFAMAMIVPHELGHLLGINGHLDDPGAVMHGEQSGGTRFTDEDLRQFHLANPGFSGLGGCHVARRIAHSPSRPALAQPPGALPVVLWAEEGQLEQASLTLDTAEPALLAAIPTSGTASYLRTVPLADGYLVCFKQGSELRCVTVKGGQPSAPVTLALDLSAIGDDIYDLTWAVLGDELYLALSAGGVRTETTASGTMSWFKVGDLLLRRFALETGEGRPFQTRGVTSTLGQLAVVDGQLLVAAGSEWSSWGLKVVRLDREGAVLDVLDGFSVAPVGMAGALQLHPRPGALLIARRTSSGALLVDRVAVGAALVHAGTAELTLPAEVEMQGRIALADLERGEVALALTLYREFRFGQTPEVDSVEVHVGQIDATSLTLTAPFRRLSTPDLAYSEAPLLAAQGQRVVAIWRDAAQRAEENLVRSRCLSFEP